MELSSIEFLPTVRLPLFVGLQASFSLFRF